MGKEESIRASRQLRLSTGPSCWRSGRLAGTEGRCGTVGGFHPFVGAGLHQSSTRVQIRASIDGTAIPPSVSRELLCIQCHIVEIIFPIRQQQRILTTGIQPGDLTPYFSRYRYPATFRLRTFILLKLSLSAHCWPWPSAFPESPTCCRPRGCPVSRCTRYMQTYYRPDQRCRVILKGPLLLSYSAVSKTASCPSPVTGFGDATLINAPVRLR